jgi:hypothetical protein
MRTAKHLLTPVSVRHHSRRYHENASICTLEHTRLQRMKISGPPQIWDTDIHKNTARHTNLFPLSKAL